MRIFPFVVLFNWLNFFPPVHACCRPHVSSRPHEVFTQCSKDGEITLDGLAGNIRVCIQYVEAWLRGIGCVPIANLMEDAATAEISRCQVWQWIKHGAKTKDGSIIITRMLVKDTLVKEHKRLSEEYRKLNVEGGNRIDLATQITEQLMLGEQLTEFLTFLTYPYLLTKEAAASAGAASCAREPKTAKL